MNKLNQHFVCNICNQQFDSKQRLCDHIIDIHNKHNDYADKDILFNCPAPGCNCKYRHKNSLNRHIRLAHRDDIAPLLIHPKKSQARYTIEAKRRHRRKIDQITESTMKLQSILQIHLFLNKSNICFTDIELINKPRIKNLNLCIILCLLITLCLLHVRLPRH